MINPLIMTREQVKSYLQIQDATYDNQIETFLPVVSSFVIDYCNNEFLESGTADTTTGSSELTNVSGIDYDNLQQGNLVKITGFTTGVTGATVVDYDEDGETIELSETATSDNEETTLYIRVFPIGYKDVVARMVWWKIKGNTTQNANEGPVKSEKIEDYSITYGDEWSKIGQGGYPMSYLESLNTIRRPKFI